MHIANNWTKRLLHQSPLSLKSVFFSDRLNVSASQVLKKTWCWLKFNSHIISCLQKNKSTDFKFHGLSWSKPLVQFCIQRHTTNSPHLHLQNKCAGRQSFCLTECVGVWTTWWTPQLSSWSWVEMSLVGKFWLNVAKL